MTAHSCTVFDPGCFRCDLNLDELPPLHVCDSGDFDRVVDACGAMHSYCSICGLLQDHCPDEPRTWQIELPITRPLSLNHRTHWAVKAKLTAEIRTAAGEVIELAGVPSLEHCRTCIYYSPRTNAIRDPINLIPTLKACEDAMKDAGVVVDDNPRFVESVMPVILPKNEERRGFLWLVIEEG
jgi:hypothetical protein